MIKFIQLHRNDVCFLQGEEKINNREEFQILTKKFLRQIFSF